MSLAGYLQANLTDFPGTWSRPDPKDVPPDHGALLALNSEFNPFGVSTRTGFADTLSALHNKNHHEMVNWITSSHNRLVAQAGSIIYVYDLAANTTETAINTASTFGWSTPAGSVIVPAGARVYAAGFDASTLGVGQGIVASAGTLSPIKLFAGPFTSKPTLGTTAGTQVAAGTHRVGYVATSLSGFTGKVCPVSSSTNLFDATSSITTSAGQAITFSLTRNWGLDAYTIYPVLTTADNLSRYFIVPGIAGVVATGVFTVTFTIDISDSDLASAGTDVTQNNLFFTQDSGGSGPFNPFNIGTFGSRMVYLTEINGVSQAYVSEPDNAEQITADEHVLYLPGQKRMVALGELGRTLYIAGPNWTYAFDDTGDIPVSWPTPRLVDGKIGTLSPHGFTIDSSTGIGWCAHPNGLFVFRGGVFDQMPVSYMVDSDWKRINFAEGANAPYTAGWNCLKVIDDKNNHRVIVLAALNCKGSVNTSGTAVTWASGDYFPTSMSTGTSEVGNTHFVIGGVGYTPSSVTDSTHLTLGSSAGAQTGAAYTYSPDYATHALVFDYSNGLSYDAVKYSLWVIKGYPPSAGCLVMNPSTGNSELWLSQIQVGVNPLYAARQMNTRDDAAPYADLGNAIDWQYQTALLPGPGATLGQVYHHYAQQIRATGSGSLHRTIYGIDGTTSVAVPDVTLSTAPGSVITTRFPRLRSEGASTLFAMNAANSYCLLAAMTHYFQKGPSFR